MLGCSVSSVMVAIMPTGFHTVRYCACQIFIIACRCGYRRLPTRASLAGRCGPDLSWLARGLTPGDAWEGACPQTVAQNPRTGVPPDPCRQHFLNGRLAGMALAIAIFVAW